MKLKIRILLRDFSHLSLSNIDLKHIFSILDSADGESDWKRSKICSELCTGAGLSIPGRGDDHENQAQWSWSPSKDTENIQSNLS